MTGLGTLPDRVRAMANELDRLDFEEAFDDDAALLVEADQLRTAVDEFEERLGVAEKEGAPMPDSVLRELEALEVRFRELVG